jgi:hypothetical protein
LSHTAFRLSAATAFGDLGDFMNTIRNLICILTAVVLAAFSLPGMAANQSQNKTYTLTMSVLSQGLGLADSQVQAVFQNTSPKQSSSTFSSVDLFIDLSWTIDSTMAVSVTENDVPTGNVDLGTAGHIKIQNLNPVKPGELLVITFYVTASSCGDGTWNASVWSGSQLGSGNFFTLVPSNSVLLSPVACADLACDATQPPEFFTAGNVTGYRWSYNKDGSAGTSCSAVNSYISNLNPTTNVIHFRWDNSAPGDTFGSAVFYYNITYPSTPTPKVGWLNQDGTPAVGPGADPSQVVFIDAQPCNTQVAQVLDPTTSFDPILPQPYGDLQVAVSTTATTIKVDTSTATVSTPPLPFDIVIGPQGAVERMTVTAMSSNGWSVTRGVGGTTVSKHPKNAFVMSTPLKTFVATPTCYDANNGMIACPAKYNPPYQVQMCLPVSGNTDNSVWYFDIGDAWSTQ